MTVFTTPLNPSNPVIAPSVHQETVAKLVALVTEFSNLPVSLPGPQSVPSLCELVIQQGLPKASPENSSWPKQIIEVLTFFDTHAFTADIRQVVIKNIMKALKFNNHPELIFAIAAVRITAGEFCQKVIQDHAVPHDDNAYHELQMIVVDGPAGARVRKGGSCAVVGAEYGISNNDKAYHALQLMAVNGPAGARVRKGESCEAVGREHGIHKYDKAYDELLMQAVRGRPVRACVRGNPARWWGNSMAYQIMVKPVRLSK